MKHLTKCLNIIYFFFPFDPGGFFLLLGELVFEPLPGEPFDVTVDFGALLGDFGAASSSVFSSSSGLGGAHSTQVYLHACTYISTVCNQK